MTTLTPPPSRAVSTLGVAAAGKRVLIMFHKQNTGILFVDQEPVAVLQATVIYQREGTAGTITRFVNEWASDTYLVARTAVENFDFIVGQVLMQAGIPLTKRV